MAKYCRIGEHGPLPGVKLVNGVCETCLKMLQEQEGETLARVTLARREAAAAMLQSQLTMIARWAFEKTNDVTVTELRRWVKARDKADDEVEEAQLLVNTMIAKRKEQENTHE